MGVEGREGDRRRLAADRTSDNNAAFGLPTRRALRAVGDRRRRARSFAHQALLRVASARPPEGEEPSPSSPCVPSEARSTRLRGDLLTRGTARGTGRIAQCVQKVAQRGRRGREDAFRDASTRPVRGSNPGAPIATKPLVERPDAEQEAFVYRSWYRALASYLRAGIEAGRSTTAFSAKTPHIRTLRTGPRRRGRPPAGSHNRTPDYDDCARKIAP
jgi:hypothetical protein